MRTRVSAKISAVLAVGLAALTLTALPPRAHAQGMVQDVGADVLISTPVATNQWLVSTQQLKLFAVIAQNSSASDIWLLGFNRRTNGIPNGSVPDIAPVRIPAATTGGWNPIGGIPCRTGLVVCVSTTDRHLTNGSAVATMTVTCRRPQ